MGDRQTYTTLETCVQDVETLVSEVKDVVTQLQAKDYGKALADVMDLAQEVPVTLKDCGLDSVAKVKDATFDHLRHVGYSEGCLADLDTIGTDALDLFEMVKDGDVDLAKAVQDAKAIMAAVPLAVKDCELITFEQDLPPVESPCAWTLNNAVVTAMALQTDVKTRNMAQIKSDGG